MDIKEIEAKRDEIIDELLDLIERFEKENELEVWEIHFNNADMNSPHKIIFWKEHSLIAPWKPPGS